MELYDVIRKRRSIRKYKKGCNICDADLKTILEAGMYAPSACNTRAWEFVVVKSAEAKEKAMLSHPFAKHLKDASLAVLVCGRPDLQEGKAQGYYPQDCSAVVENMLLQAYDLGYGSCWCGVYPREDRVSAFQKEFNLTSVPFALVIFGVADEEPIKKGFYDENKVKFV